MSSKAKDIGNQAEIFAKEYLVNQGLQLVTENFFSRFGEIDIIMRDGDCLVFIEVRQRKSSDLAIESITRVKQKKIIKTAQYYLLKLGRECNCRFDVVALDEMSQVSWLKNVIIL